MKRVVLLSVFAIAAIAFWSCRKDVTITPPPSLSGDYAGYYIFQSGVTPPETMCITIRFTQETFLEVWDSVVCPDRPAACPAKGGYRLDANVVLYPIQLIDTNYQARSCALARHPFGSYIIDQSIPGKVTLVSQTGTGETLVYRKFDVDITN